MISPLLTDLYQLTMAHGYFRAGRMRDQARLAREEGIDCLMLAPMVC